MERRKQCPKEICPICHKEMRKQSTSYGLGRLWVCADCHWWEGVEEEEVDPCQTSSD